MRDNGPGSTAWALLAVSSDSQAGTLKDQRAWALAEAKTKGWHIARFFEGVATGKHGARALVSQMIAELGTMPPAERPHWLLATRFDRMGRGDSILETQIAAHKLKELGVRIWTRLSGEIKLDEPFEQLLVAVQAFQSSFENSVRRDKAVNKYKEKREKGLAVGNQRAYGLRIGEDGRDEPDGKLADVVGVAFRLRLKGLGYLAIGHELAKIAPPRVYKRSKSGSPRNIRWTPTRVKRMLENRAYVGPVIDELTFARAQQVRERLSPARPQQRFPWPLSGVVRCYCGRAMVGLACGAPEKRTRYYRCAATWNHGGSMRLVRADVLEEQFVTVLGRLRASENAVSRYRRAAAPAQPRLLEQALSQARRDLAAVERERDAVWRLHANGHVRDADVQERLDEILPRRQAAIGRITSLEQQLLLARSAMAKDRDADEMLRRAARAYGKATPEDRRRLARAVAVAVGGLCVTEAGRLVVRRVDDPQRQRARRAAEL